MKIVVVGCGYVGLANGLMLARKNQVCMADIDRKRVERINRRSCPIQDSYMEAFLREERLEIEAELPGKETYRKAEWIILALPTDFDPERSRFRTELLEETVGKIRQQNREAWIAVKSTVPIGYTQELYRKDPSRRILYSPEFLREGKALEDCLSPSRILVGIPDPEEEDDDRKREELDRAGKELAKLLGADAFRGEAGTRLLASGEAEAVKLFSNAYLAMRVAFFNEVDMLAETRGYRTKSIVEGICMDPRIGDFYNNPSFGYGGYCLPKDTRQLLSDFSGIPGTMIQAAVESNRLRKEYVIRRLLETGADPIGIYRLAMKSGSDNYRQSSALDVIKGLKGSGRTVLIFDPGIREARFMGCEVVASLEEFCERSQVIAANRLDGRLEAVSEKVYTRDLYQRD